MNGNESVNRIIGEAGNTYQAKRGGTDHETTHKTVSSRCSDSSCDIVGWSNKCFCSKSGIWKKLCRHQS